MSDDQAEIEAEIDYEASYESLVEFLYLAPVGIIKFKPCGLIEMANPAAAQLLMPLDKCGDMSDLYRLLSGLAPDLASHVERFQPDAGQICDQMELVVETTGNTLMLDVNKIDPRTLMAVVQDVSDLTEARRQIMRKTSSQRLLSSVFGGIAIPVVVARVDGFILMTNIVFQTLMEYDAKSLLGLNIDALLPSEFGEAARAARSQQMLTGSCYEHEIEIVSRSGRQHNMLMKSALLRESNQQQLRVITLIPGGPSARPASDGAKSLGQNGLATVNASQVQVVSITVFKMAIGADWTFMSSRALDLCETLLRQLVGVAGIVKRGKDDSFIIWLSDNNSERNATISERARVGVRRLFVTEFGSKIAARIEVALAAEKAITADHVAVT